MFTSIAHAMGGSPNPDAPMSQQLMSSLLPLVMIIVVFYFLLIRPQQKKTKEHKMMQEALKPGDRVITNGGFFGRIVEINGEEAIVDLGETKVTVARVALNVVNQSQGQSKTDKSADKKPKK